MTTFITVRFPVAYLDFLFLGGLGFLGFFCCCWLGFFCFMGWVLNYFLLTQSYFLKGQSNIVLSSWGCEYTVRYSGPSGALPRRRRNMPEVLAPCENSEIPDLGVYRLLASCGVCCAVKRLAAVHVWQRCCHLVEKGRRGSRGWCALPAWGCRRGSLALASPFELCPKAPLLSNASWD